MRKIAFIVMLMLLNSLYAQSKHEALAVEFYQLNLVDNALTEVIKQQTYALVFNMVVNLHEYGDHSYSQTQMNAIKDLLSPMVARKLDLREMRIRIIPSIRTHFSEKELKSINRFLVSPEGVKYLATQHYRMDKYLNPIIEEFFKTLSQDELWCAEVANKILKLDEIKASSTQEPSVKELVKALQKALSQLGSSASDKIKETSSESKSSFVAFEEPPQVIGQISPIYPPEARNKGIQGRVILEVSILKDGSISDIEVKRSDNSLLNEAAIDAIKKVRFKPGKAKGMPIDTKVVIPIDFRLN